MADRFGQCQYTNRAMKNDNFMTMIMIMSFSSSLINVFVCPIQIYIADIVDEWLVGIGLGAGAGVVLLRQVRTLYTLNGRGAKWALHVALAPALAPAPASSQSGAARSDYVTGECESGQTTQFHNSIIPYWPMALNEWARGGATNTGIGRIGLYAPLRVRRNGGQA